MKRILCYGDSNTWGYDPGKRMNPDGGYGRFPEHIRWTGVMEELLGPEYRVLEEGLNGRTTVFDDPTAYGRNGNDFLEIAIRTCDPLDCIIFMLGTNDAKDCFHASSEMISCGMARLLRTCQSALLQVLAQNPKIILACPVKSSCDGNGVYWYDFSAKSTQKGEALRKRYRLLAKQTGCSFFDVNEYVTASPVDGVHLTAESHRILGEAMADFVRQVLEG